MSSTVSAADLSSGPAANQYIHNRLQNVSFNPLLFFLDMANKIVFKGPQSRELFFLIMRSES